MGKAAEKFTIRRMADTDVEGVAQVEADAFTAPWPPALFAEELKNPLTHYIVLEAGKKICGYAGFWLVAGEAQVTNIALLKKHQGKGWGSSLVEALIKMAEGCGADSMVLEVRKSNLAAQNLYEKLGLAVVGERKGYYMDDGEDALLMGRQLKEEEDG